MSTAQLDQWQKQQTFASAHGPMEEQAEPSAEQLLLRAVESLQRAIENLSDIEYGARGGEVRKTDGPDQAKHYPNGVMQSSDHLAELASEVQRRVDSIARMIGHL